MANTDHLMRQPIVAGGIAGDFAESLRAACEADPLRDLRDLATTPEELLDTVEHDWLDAYHARVRETVAPLLDGPDREWLERATAPVA